MKNLTFQEVEQKILSKYNGRDFDSYDMYSWSLESDRDNTEGILYPFRAEIENLLNDYDGLYLYVDQQASTITFYISNGYQYERRALFFVKIKRKVKGTNCWGRRIYSLDSVVVYSNGNFKDLDEVLLEAKAIAEEITEKSSDEANDLLRDLALHNLTVKSLNELYSKYTNLSPQAKTIVSK